MDNRSGDSVGRQIVQAKIAALKAIADAAKRIQADVEKQIADLQTELACGHGAWGR